MQNRHYNNNNLRNHNNNNKNQNNNHNQNNNQNNKKNFGRNTNHCQNDANQHPYQQRPFDISKYCHTHGACSHESKDCRIPGNNHQNTAALGNMMGGSTNYCQHCD